MTPLPNEPDGAPGGNDFTDLISLITSTVSPSEWRVNGGPDAEIRPFPTNLSLVVSCSGAMHRETKELLAQVRKLGYQLPDDFVTQVRALKARKTPQQVPLRAYSRATPDNRKRLLEQFNVGVGELTGQLGAPEVHVAGEVSFPEWAAAQRIALWELESGVLYFALQDCRPQGEAIVAGWWEESLGVQQPLQLTAE